MRFAPLILALSLCASPALAQAAGPRPGAIQLPPDTAERITDSMQSLSKAVRSAAGRDDPRFERDVRLRIADAKPKIEQGIKAVNDALPEVTADLQRAQEAIERAIANMPDPNYPRR